MSNMLRTQKLAYSASPSRSLAVTASVKVKCQVKSSAKWSLKGWCLLFLVLFIVLQTQKFSDSSNWAREPCLWQDIWKDPLAPFGLGSRSWAWRPLCRLLSSCHQQIIEPVAILLVFLWWEVCKWHKTAVHPETCIFSHAGFRLAQGRGRCRKDLGICALLVSKLRDLVCASEREQGGTHRDSVSPPFALCFYLSYLMSICCGYHLDVLSKPSTFRTLPSYLQCWNMGRSRHLAL